MSHNLNIIDGKASFFTVKEKAWHSLGLVLDQCPTSEEAIKYAGLNYDVIKTPNFAMINGVYRQTPTSYTTYRSDNNEILGDKLGARYEIVQNRDAFAFFDAIVGEGEAIYETAGALGKGETIFVTAKLPSYIRVGNDDEIEKYLLLTMSHDGSGAIKALFTPIRVVCNNTLTAALQSCTNSVSIKHTKSVQDNLKNAHKILGITNRLSSELEEIFNSMSRVKVSDKELSTYIETLFPSSKEKEEESARIVNIRHDIYEYAHLGAGQDLVTCEGTIFGAYNAVTGYFQNVKEFKDSDMKMKSNLMGSNYGVMQNAFDLALTYLN